MKRLFFLFLFITTITQAQSNLVFYTRLDQHPSPSPNVYLSAGSYEVHATSSDGNNGSIEAVTINGIEYNSN